ncbi:MAG: hypothetical protein KAT00_15230, partial [Planctomycetes bacterium]|nr:hypothetical protein [Planctomycetota bacterium]
MADDIHNPQYLVFIEQYARTRNPQKAAHAAKFRDKGMGKRLLKKPEILKAVLARQAELRTLV